MKDYRPISCCNVIYKVISKILANKLKLLLPTFIAGNQSAFVKDRLLIENVLLATELVKDYHKGTISHRCAIKIDISKAFDSVQWPFLRNVLTALDLPQEFVHWIMLCVKTASFSIQVNGELAGFFNNSRGLRQGCSLSPYLFVIVMDVLSRLLDKEAGLTFGYHPHCKDLGVTHLSFADDIMVLSDGQVRSIEDIVSVFEKFAKISGLRISMEKSIIYLGGLNEFERQEVMNSFSFAVGQLPVRYLGLPLVTKRLTESDYAPLIDQIKQKIGSWTARFLSFAGRLNLIQSVLWSIWGDSLWVKWLTTTLLKRKNFWSLPQSTTAGSWMWRKLLKLRPLAARERGVIELGISIHMTVADAWGTRRQRRHRLQILTQIEAEIDSTRDHRNANEDVVLWRGKNEKFHPNFSTKETWKQIRNPVAEVNWHKGVWFSHCTPKHSFCTWLAAQNRLSTGDRVAQWSRIDPGNCVFCNNTAESRDHLFFSCHFSSEVWQASAKNIYKNCFSTSWNSVVDAACSNWPDQKICYLARSVLQATVYTLWHERNGRKHGEPPNPPSRLIQQIDKQIRDQLLAIALMGIGVTRTVYSYG
ncbi:PREDICTED: uncharacterized protein LOC109129106 [Camelina sativa]|uniref:Uncharacterized protein LOC109129106 n=1 Tax=Camelina sativa TaxID=90675 RepID=A0ABM1QZU0_CAMSA|nr:PREDICTED: uncharacterized protein LOC109129106 [Camelina sativa]